MLNREQVRKQNKRANKKGRSLKLTVEEFTRITEEYLADCEKENKAPFLVGLSLRLGIGEDTLVDYGKRPVYANLVKKVKEIGKAKIMERLQNTDKALVNHIFLAKAVFGLRDNTAVDITSDGKPLGVVVLPKRGR